MADPTQGRRQTRSKIVTSKRETRSMSRKANETISESSLKESAQLDIVSPGVEAMNEIASILDKIEVPDARRIDIEPFFEGFPEEPPIEMVLIEKFGDRWGLEVDKRIDFSFINTADAIGKFGADWALNNKRPLDFLGIKIAQETLVLKERIDEKPPTDESTSSKVIILEHVIISKPNLLQEPDVEMLNHEDTIKAAEWGIDIPEIKVKRRMSDPLPIPVEEKPFYEVDVEDISDEDAGNPPVAIISPVRRPESDEVPEEVLSFLDEFYQKYVKPFEEAPEELYNETAREIEDGPVAEPPEYVLPEEVQVQLEYVPEIPPEPLHEAQEPVPVVVRQPVRYRTLSERLPLIHNWTAVVTNPTRAQQTRKVMPTEYIPANSKYYDQCRQERIPYEGLTIREVQSRYDRVNLRIEIYATGELFVTRCGQRTRIRSTSSSGHSIYNIGGQLFWPPHPFADGPQIRPHKTDWEGVRTEDIPIQSPYWARLVQDLRYPEEGEIHIPRESRIDKAKCLLYIESNGRVTVTRKGYRFQLLPPF